MKTKIIIILTAVLMMSSCSVAYDVVLTGVTVKSKSSAPVLSSSIEKIKVGLREHSYAYEDSDIRVEWVSTISSLELVLTNKSRETIRIPWDDVTYVDENGYMQKCMHQGVSYLTRGLSHPIMSIPEGAKLRDGIVPNDHYTSNGIELPLFQASNIYMGEDKIKGKSISVLMPIIVGDEYKEYHFNFVIGNQKMWI